MKLWGWRLTQNKHALDTQHCMVGLPYFDCWRDALNNHHSTIDQRPAAGTPRLPLNLGGGCSKIQVQKLQYYVYKILMHIGVRAW